MKKAGENKIEIKYSFRESGLHNLSMKKAGEKLNKKSGFLSVKADLPIPTMRKRGRK